MPEFKYKAMDKKGNVYTSTLQARSRIDCISILKRNKLQPLDITETKNNLKIDDFLKNNDKLEIIVENENIRIKNIHFSGEKFLLEVNENNIKALKLYKKIGFEQISVRKNYYGNNENAIIMMKII